MITVCRKRGLTYIMPQNFHINLDKNAFQQSQFIHSTAGHQTSSIYFVCVENSYMTLYDMNHARVRGGRGWEKKEECFDTK